MRLSQRGTWKRGICHEKIQLCIALRLQDKATPIINFLKQAEGDDET